MFTIGYEGLSPEAFLDRLIEHNVDVLADVREIPMSRKKGFSKSKLENLLKKHEIEYVHLKDLGSPTPLRRKLKLDHDYGSFFKEYSIHLLGSATNSLEILQKLAVQRKVCLMCFERDANHCHRRIVAEEVKKMDGNGLVVKHL